jgi:hypothetical protein
MFESFILGGLLGWWTARNIRAVQLQQEGRVQPKLGHIPYFEVCLTLHGDAFPLSPVSSRPNQTSYTKGEYLILSCPSVSPFELSKVM